MVLPPLVRRVVAALLAPWFAVVAADPAAVHRCDMHMAPVAAQAAAVAMPMGHDHAAMMRHADGHQADRHGTSNTPPASHHCTCPGGCCASAPVAVQVTPELTWVPVFVLRGAPVSPTISAPVSDAEHVLPFANGPPSRV